MNSLEVKVWGEYACFTRPEMKVDRVSYLVMTPSAARGILEAIFWKPEFTWRIREIHILRPIRHFSILRNEVTSKATARRSENYYADADRAQRHTLGLRDVAYRIRADIALKPHCTDDPAKYRDQFRRRVARGQCFHRPSLGCREFAADFSETLPGERPIGISMDLGLMLFDIRYNSRRGQPNEAIFFQGIIEEGVLVIPEELYQVGAV